MGKSLVIVKQKPWLWPLCLILVLIITVLAFSRVYGFQFIDWDDQAYIVNNPLLTKISFSNFNALFHLERHTSLALLSFSFDYYFFGLNPGAFHLVNLFIHLINIMLVFLLARKLNIEPLGALVVAVLFALHPMRVETVAWVMQRKDLLYTMFFLIGILIYIRYVQKGSRNLMLILCVFIVGFLSLLSKIQGYVFPALLVLIDIYLKRKIDFRNIFEKSVLIVIFIFCELIIIRWLFILTTFSFLHLQYFYNFSKSFPFLQKKAVINSAELSFRQLCYRYLFIFVIIILAAIINLFTEKTMVIWTGTKFFKMMYMVLAFYLFGAFTEWLITNKIAKLSLRRILLIAVPACVIIVLAGILFIYRTNFGFGENVPAQESSLMQRAIMAAYSLSYYILRFFFPFKLNAVETYPLLIGGKFPFIYYLSFLLPTAILALLIVYRKKLKKHRAIIIFCLFFFLINIFMVLHLVPIKGIVVVGNRYTYMPYLGFFLLAGYFISRNSKKIKTNFFLIILAAFAVLLGIYNYNISGAWQNSKTFWNDAIEKNPKNYFAWEGLGNMYRMEGDNNSAMKAYDHSASLNPLSGSLYKNRGVLKLNSGYYSEAIIDLSEAIRLQILSGVDINKKDAIYDYSSPYFNRGNAYLFMKNYSLALQDYNTAITMITVNPAYFANRSLVKVLMNDINGAQKDIQSALQLDPRNAIALYNRGIISFMQNDPVKANADISAAMAIEPKVSDLFKQYGLDINNSAGLSSSDQSSNTYTKYVNQAITKARAGNFSAALSDLNTAIDIDPKNYIAYRNRANVKYDLKDFSGAIKDCNRAIELLPDDSKSYFIRAKVYDAIGNQPAACNDWKKAASLGDKKAEELLMEKCK